jgi:hypothetical protein
MAHSIQPVIKVVDKNKACTNIPTEGMKIVKVSHQLQQIASAV